MAHREEPPPAPVTLEEPAPAPGAVAVEPTDSAGGLLEEDVALLPTPQMSLLRFETDVRATLAEGAQQEFDTPATSDAGSWQTQTQKRQRITQLHCNIQLKIVANYVLVVIMDCEA